MEGSVLILLISGCFGLIIGSFISMLSWRLPRMLALDPLDQVKGISVGGSKCPSCCSRLPWYRLLPLFSWLFSRGRCHSCSVNIPLRYPLIELATACLTATVVFVHGITPEAGVTLVLLWFLISISVIDIEHQLILDSLSLPLIWLGLLASVLFNTVSPEDAILGAAAGYLSFWLVFQGVKAFSGKAGAGYGDFKLFSAIGAWVGVFALPQVIIIASLLSVVASITLLFLTGRPLSRPMAFGPFLAIGAIGTSLFDVGLT